MPFAAAVARNLRVHCMLPRSALALLHSPRRQVPQGVGTVALDVPARESLPDDAYITLARIAASFA